MKFLTDVGVGRLVERMLISMGHDVASMIDSDPTASDITILQIAYAEERIIITMDKDFGDLIFHSKFNHKGILLLRLEDMIGKEKKKIMKHIIENFSERLLNNFCVYKNGKFRVSKR